MAIKETRTPLMVKNNATYKTVEGVTYFKLKSEFDGDYTKHCGLLGEEIDENFYFLRGYDIESITIDEDRNLVINRVDKDYEPLVVNIGEELGQPSFKFNKETGVITVTYPDGTTSTMEGFLVEGKDIRIATDSTMNGNGTMYNPLRISPIETTGTFAPADEYFDLTTVAEMPIGKGKGYRVVTKEKIDNFGCLYPFSAVKKIQNALTISGSQWRVPTKKDWDELLNALECAEDRNHSANTCTWLGKVAGAGLKSAKMWNEYETLPTEVPTNGQDIKGLTIYPVGITPDRNEILNEREKGNFDAEGFGQITGMWSNTLTEEGNAYVKLFGYNSAKVDQDTYGVGARMSIRLVKDYAYSNYNEIENILGFPYPTTLVYGIYDDYDYAKIWTTINFYSDAQTLDGIRSQEWSAVTDSDRGIKIIYFINEWDGTEWHKKPMENGDSVIIVDREGKPYHEWRIIEGELIDTAEALAMEFERDFAEVKEDIAELSATTKELVQFSGWVVETINEFSAATEEHINRIDATVAEFSAATVAEVARLDGKVDELSATTEAFSAATVAEVARLDADVAFVSGEVVTLSAATVAFSAATVAEIARLDADVAFVSGEVVTLSASTVAFSAATVAEIARLDADVAFVSGEVVTLSASTVAFSAATVAEVARLDGKVDELSATTEAFSAATVAEVARLDGKDLVPDTYVLDGNASSEMVIPTYSVDVEDVKIKVSESFFNFGTFENNEE